MASLATPFISAALSRLRGWVCLCCWVVALSLVTQLVIWGVASFMDVRYTILEVHAVPAAVVSAGDVAGEPTESPDVHPVDSPLETKAGAAAAPNPNRVTTKYDHIMHCASDFAMSAGVIAMVFMIPMLMVGVMLSAGSATPGIDNVVSSFMWSLVVALLVLPVGRLVGLPWNHGGLVPYEYMTPQVDVQMVPGKWGSPIFHARFMLLPLACVFGVGMIGFRFSLGVVSGIIPREDMRLDPALEREAGNLKVTSLIGGRTSAALRNVSPVAPLTAPAAPIVPAVTAVTTGGASEIKPGMLQANAGDAPRRLI